MKQYIDKSALVAEIKNRRDSFYSLSKSCEKGTPAKAGFYAQAQTLEGILSFLDTLETKEVDLEKEVEDWVKTGPHTSYPWCTIPDAIRITAEHFYELGLKAREK